MPGTSLKHFNIGMIYQKHLPAFPLADYVDSIIYLEGNNKGTGLPKTAMSLVFNLEDSFKLYASDDFNQYTDYKKHWVAGLQTTPRHVASYGVSKMIVVQFKYLGAFVFLNDPLHYYTDEYISLDHIFKHEADETWEQLKAAPSLEEKFVVTEKFLYRKLLLSRLPNSKFIAMMGSLFDPGSSLPITAVCKKFGISRKHLNYLAKTYTGVSPKMLSSLHRLQTTLKTISAAATNKLTDVAYELDYFDQAHFNNDFKRFTHLKPTEYLKLVAQYPSLKIVPHFLPFQ